MTIELLMTMPPKERMPSIAMNPIAHPVTKSPSTTPMTPSGTAARMTAGFSSELYYTVSISTISSTEIPTAATTWDWVAIVSFSSPSTSTR